MGRGEGQLCSATIPKTKAMTNQQKGRGHKYLRKVNGIDLFAKKLSKSNLHSYQPCVNNEGHEEHEEITSCPL